MSSNDDYLQAEQLLWEGRHAAAAAVLLTSIRDTPRSAQSVYLLGVARLLDGRLAEARLLIDRAFEIKRWIKDVGDDVVDLKPAAEVASRLMPDWLWPRYELERQAFPALGMTFDWVVRLQLARDDIFFIQVGANDGASSKDPIHRFVKEHRWSGLCVEPMKEAFQRLTATYDGNPRVTPVNVAVADEDGTRQMYLPKEGNTTLASLMPDRNIMAKRQDLQVVDVEAMSFPTLCERFNVSAVDVLQVDTEGYDYHVLRFFDLKRFRPLVVNLEMFCLPLDERLACFKLLREHDYAYQYDGKDMIAVDRAVFDADLCVVDRTAGAWLLDA